MGAALGKKSAARQQPQSGVRVTLDQQSEHMVGQRATGKAHLMIQDLAVDAPNGVTLQLRVTLCVERETRVDGRPWKEARDASDGKFEHEIFRSPAAELLPPGKVHAGQLSVPWAMVLPRGLPPSLAYGSSVMTPTTSPYQGVCDAEKFRVFVRWSLLLRCVRRPPPAVPRLKAQLRPPPLPHPPLRRRAAPAGALAGAAGGLGERARAPAVPEPRHGRGHAARGRRRGARPGRARRGGRGGRGQLAGQRRRVPRAARDHAPRDHPHRGGPHVPAGARRAGARPQPRRRGRRRAGHRGRGRAGAGRPPQPARRARARRRRERGLRRRGDAGVLAHGQRQPAAGAAAAGLQSGPPGGPAGGAARARGLGARGAAGRGGHRAADGGGPGLVPVPGRAADGGAVCRGGGGAGGAGVGAAADGWGRGGGEGGAGVGAAAGGGGAAAVDLCRGGGEGGDAAGGAGAAAVDLCWGGGEGGAAAALIGDVRSNSTVRNMGNGSSSSSAVRIALDKPAFAGGEEVTGTANLMLSGDLDINGVFLSIRGREKTSWREEKEGPPGEDGQPGPKVWEQHRGRHTLFEQKMQIMPAGKLSAGQLAVPFRFYLPPGMIPTFQWAKGGSHWGNSENERAEVLYTIACVVDASGWTARDATHVAPLKVLPSPQRPPQPLTVHDEKNVTMFCCINKGRVSATFRLAADTFPVGAPVELVAEVKNDSTVELPRLRMTLTRHVQLHDDRGATEHESVTMLNQVFPGFAAGEDCTGDNARRVSFNVTMDNGEASPPLRSRLIQCRYNLEATIAIPWGFDLDVSLPVQLVFGAQQIFAPVEQAPADWNPQVQAPVQVELPMAQALVMEEPPMAAAIAAEGDGSAAVAPAGAGAATATVVPAAGSGEEEALPVAAPL